MPTHEIGSNSLPYKNEKSPTGTEPIARCEVGDITELVVYQWTNRNQFVVWHHNMKLGGFFWGHYFSTRAEALEYFCQKVHRCHSQEWPTEEEIEEEQQFYVAENEALEKAMSGLTEEQKMIELEKIKAHEDECRYWSNKY